MWLRVMYRCTNSVPKHKPIITPSPSLRTALVVHSECRCQRVNYTEISLEIENGAENIWERERPFSLPPRPIMFKRRWRARTGAPDRCWPCLNPARSHKFKRLSNSLCSRDITEWRHSQIDANQLLNCTDFLTRTILFFIYIDMLFLLWHNW